MAARISKKEISALINLLDDPDEGIYTHVKDKFISFGTKVIPHLELAWESSFDMMMQKRIEEIIHTIQYETISKELCNWAKKEQDNLLKGILLVARYQYPDLDEEKIIKQINQIKQDVWLEINDELTALEKVKIINHILFDVHQFSGNIANYHAPQNSFFNAVLESKKGNPVSLGILYMIIAQELKIPIYGVNLPEHFIVAYVNEFANLLNLMDSNAEADNVLFYVNPFSKGIIFSKKDIDQFLVQLKLDPKASFYRPCSNLDIIKRVIRNLIYSYEKLGHVEKIEELNVLLNTLDKIA
ncbi:MAG: transglutaminase-like domain-containing protein [Bacteroidota bacterium]|nr:transglutaminase-like domain-containing protein [Bacteroidota bacterium]